MTDASPDNAPTLPGGGVVRSRRDRSDGRWYAWYNRETKHWNVAQYLPNSQAIARFYIFRTLPDLMDACYPRPVLDASVTDTWPPRLKAIYGID